MKRFVIVLISFVGGLILNFPVIIFSDKMGWPFFNAWAWAPIAPMLNEKGLDKEINVKENGFVAFLAHTDYPAVIKVDVKNKISIF